MSEALQTHQTSLRIRADHPSLPGHFPGEPVVPGVVLLDHVLSGAERWLGRTIRVRQLQQAKFVAPLLPDEDAQVELRLAGRDLRFAVTCRDRPIAQGLFTIELAAQGAIPDGTER